MFEDHGQDEEPLGGGAWGERPLQRAGRVPVEQVAHPCRDHAPVNRPQRRVRPFRADGGPVGALVAGGGALLDVDERADPLTVRVGDGAFPAARVDVPAGADVVLHVRPERLRIGAVSERLAVSPVWRGPVDDPSGALPVAGGSVFGRNHPFRLLWVGARGAAHGRGGRDPVAVRVDAVPEPCVVDPGFRHGRLLIYVHACSRAYARPHAPSRGIRGFGRRRTHSSMRTPGAHPATPEGRHQ